MNGSFSTTILVSCQNHPSGGLWQPSCCLLPQGNGGCWLSLLSFSLELCLMCLVRPSKVSGAGTAQQHPTFQVLNHPTSPWCWNSSTSHARSGSLPELCATTPKSFSLPTPKAPVDLLPSGLFVQGRWLWPSQAQSHVPHTAIWRGKNVILLLRFVLCECRRAGIALYLLLCTCKTQTVCSPGMLALIRREWGSGHRQGSVKNEAGWGCDVAARWRHLLCPCKGNPCWIPANGMEGATWCFINVP